MTATDLARSVLSSDASARPWQNLRSTAGIAIGIGVLVLVGAAVGGLVHPLVLVAGAVAAVGALLASLAPVIGSTALAGIAMLFIGGSAFFAVELGNSASRMELLINGVAGFCIFEGVAVVLLTRWARRCLRSPETTAPK